MTTEQRITRKELVARWWADYDLPPKTYARVLSGKDTDCEHSINVTFYDDNTYQVWLDLDTGEGFRVAHDIPGIQTLADLDRLVSLLTGQEPVCEYNTTRHGNYTTGCGGRVVRGYVIGNYCPHCGKLVVVKE